MEKPDSHNLGQVIKANINSDVCHGDNICPGYGVMRRALYLWVFLSQTHNPCLIKRKTSDQPQLKLKTVHVIKHYECLRNCPSLEALRRHDH